MATHRTWRARRGENGVEFLICGAGVLGIVYPVRSESFRAGRAPLRPRPGVWNQLRHSMVSQSPG